MDDRHGSVLSSAGILGRDRDRNRFFPDAGGDQSNQRGALTGGRSKAQPNDRLGDPLRAFERRTMAAISKAFAEGRTTLPAGLESAYRQLERHLDADAGVGFHLDIQNLEKELEQTAEPFAVRRMIERNLANYILNDVAPRYGDPRLVEIGQRMLVCRCSGCAGVAESGDGAHRLLRTWDEKCGQTRLCPDESRTETQRLKRRYAPTIRNFLHTVPDARLYYIVLTIPNVARGQLHDGMKSIYQHFANLIRTKKWERFFKGKDGGHGALARLENPLSAHGDWNVHLNVMLMTTGFFPYREFRQAWAKQCGLDDAQVEVRRVKGDREGIEKSINELIKYVALHVGEKAESKGQGSAAPGMTDWPPEAFYEWFNAQRAFRFTRSYGALYKVKDIEKSDVDMDSVEWVAGCEFTGERYRHRLHGKRLGLILGNKSTERAETSARNPARARGPVGQLQPQRGYNHVCAP